MVKIEIKKMKVCNSNINENGLGRQFASEGFGDLRVLVGGEEIRCSKAVFMISNCKMRELIENNENDNIIELFEECSIEAFFEIEKYYSGGYINIKMNNVCEILSMCIYYNENVLIPICLKFIRNHLNEEILIKLIKITHIYDDEEESIKELREVKKIINKYIKKSGYKLLKEEYINELEFKDIKMILKEMKYIKNNETWLFEVLFKWYEKEMKKYRRKRNEKKEFEKELIELMKNCIDFDNIKMKILKSEEIEFINNNINLNLCLMNNRKEENKYKYIDLERIKEKEIEEIILKYYIEREIITIEERDLEILENININKMNEIIKILLINEDIKMKEIGMMLILDSKIKNEKIYELIDKEEISKIIFLLSNEYEINVNKNERIYKCFCLFVNDIEYIRMMRYFSGIEILFHILNYENYLSNYSKELLINYIKCQKVNVNEYERMIKILNNDQILSEFTDKLSYFFYPSSIVKVYGDFSIKPKYDGCKCLFSINPLLPKEIILNSQTGEIGGKIDNKIEEIEYTVKCENLLNKLEYKISFEYDEVIFSEEYKNKEITISNNGKTITNNNNDSYLEHCFINLKMENGIYHFKYKFMRNGSSSNAIDFTLSTKICGGDYWDFKNDSCAYWGGNVKSKDITRLCHIGTVVTSNPNFINHGDGSIYEVIVDMNKREFSVCHNNSSPVVLVKDLPSPLYPCAKPGSKGCSIELLSVSHYE